MSATLSPLFSWRGQIAKSDLPPPARHVALTLSLFMNEMGTSCWPSLTKQCEATGLSRATVCKHLEVLEETGWIVREKGGKGKSTHYIATIPQVVRVTDYSQETVVREVNGGSPSAKPELVTYHVKGQEQDQELDLAATPRTRADRDSIWDALEAIFGAPGTRTAKSLRGRIVSSLLEAGATVAQVEAAPAAYHQRMPEGTTLTETALEKHWPLLSMPVETLIGPKRPNTKYGRRNVTAGEMLAAAARLEEERKSLAPG